MSTETSTTPSNPFQFIPPEMTVEAYADMQNLTKAVVQNQILRGHLPSIKRGRYRMVNTAKLFWDNVNKVA